MKLAGARLAARQGDWPSLIAWAAMLVAFVNAMAFVLHCTNPVLMSDDWYFLDVFVRKAVGGNLHFADFFVKRVSGDHAEPFIKLILLWCARGFDLDISFEAFIGVFIATGCVLLFRSLILSETRAENAWPHQLAWVAVAALIFSLNGAEIWLWALNSLQYSSFFLLPVFMWVVWRAYQREEYGLLIVVTFLTAVVGDDNAIIGIAATLAALLLHAVLGKGSGMQVPFRIFGSVLAVLLIVRIGYTYAPLIGGGQGTPLADRLHALLGQLESGEWLQWIKTPMTWALASSSILPDRLGGASTLLDYCLLGIMLFLQGWFWVKAVRSEWNLQIFVAICLMLLTYGWIAGILLYRVPEYGADYFQQPRYVRLFQFDPIALILMWSGSIRKGAPPASKSRALRLGTAACLALLAMQVPLSVTAWAISPYGHQYYRDLARQIYALAVNPADPAVLGHCNPQLPICGYPLEVRKDLLQLLRDHHLNIFSPAVLLDHPYLLDAMGVLDATERKALFASMQKYQADESTQHDAFESIRALFLNRRERAPSSGVDVNAWPAEEVPSFLGGCWGADGKRPHASSWCGPDVSAVLQRPSASASLTINGWLPWSSYEKAGRTSPVAIAVTLNDVLVNKTAIAAEGPFTITIPSRNLPTREADSDLVLVRITTDGSFRPSRPEQSMDTRDLSIKLSSVKFSGETSTGRVLSP